MKSRPYIFSEISKTPKADAIIILGASVFADGRMSDMFADRSDAALELYKNNKAGKILISGDHTGKNYDEVNPAKNYLLERGVRKNDIFLDHAGLDTYDSLYRAKEVFKIKSAIIATQNFHLPRAVYIGRTLGIDSYGFRADRHLYRDIKLNELREIFADVKAFIDVNSLAKPEFLGEPIPISGDSSKSWKK